MIIWIASYPKSGNTWIRSLLSSYLFTKNGTFSFKLLEKIEQFSSSNLAEDKDMDLHYQNRISKNWIPAQKLINKDKKIHILKTHNAMCSINNNNYTDKYNTLAAIYIVRDPRNLINSLSHHYEFTLEKTFDFMTNKRKIIFPLGQKNNNNNVEDKDFNFLSDWSSHYNSWKNINFCEIKIVKYEDLLKNTEEGFLSILNFLSKYVDIKIKKNKILNTLYSTNFENLKQMEIKHGFKESVTSSKTNKKIDFFHLGKNNKWENMLNKKFVKKIEESFLREMKELKYL